MGAIHVHEFMSLDGVIDAHTAAMLEPYADDTASGAPTMDPDAFNRMVRLLDAGGWQVMTHAVGDRAVNMALTAYEHAVRSNPQAACPAIHSGVRGSSSQPLIAPEVKPATICRLKKMYRSSIGMVITRMFMKSRFHWVANWPWNVYSVR